MREVSIKIYKFAELSKKAREAVKQRWVAAFGYGRQDEAFESLKKLAEHFGGKLVDWSVDFFECSYSFAEFEIPEDTEDTEGMSEAEIGRRLADLGSFDSETLRGTGECKLTGVCTDEYAIDGFRIAWFDGERDLNKLMQAAFHSWLKACQEDCEDEYSDATFAEMCEANEYEFFVDGTRYRD